MGENTTENTAHTTILVAMSGGVDSSLTAALLHEQGYHVVGATMILRQGRDSADTQHIEQTVADAQKVCQRLGIPHHLLDYQAAFRQQVIHFFIEGYARGTTPNPCLACNRHIKFFALQEHARELGCQAMATGHYARIVSPSPAADTPFSIGRYALLRGVDRARDQSYVLYMLQQHELARLHFPLGTLSKHEVRALAQERGLETAHRSESQDICFIPDKNYRRFLREEAPSTLVPGPILDQQGHEIGHHQGIPLYTVGQRKGLGIASTEPLFVTAIDPTRNALVVGPHDATLQTDCTISGASFVSGQWPEQPFPCEVQVRAHASPAAATATPLDDQQVHLRFDTPQRAITPGQAAVLYGGDTGDMVLGGGCITQQLELPEPPGREST